GHVLTELHFVRNRDVLLPLRRRGRGNVGAHRARHECYREQSRNEPDHVQSSERCFRIVGRVSNLPQRAYRSISPITTSMLPTIAGTSATRQPRHSSFVTLRFAKQLDRARTRSGTPSFEGRPTTWKPICPRGHSVST